METTDILSLQTTVRKLLYEYLGAKGTGFLDFLGHLLLALLILVIGFKLVKYVVRVCERVFTRSNMDATLQTFLLSFIKISLKILLIFWAVTKIGVAPSSIIAVVGSAGLALGLALQGSLTNIAGGVILLFMKPFKVGDYILEDSSGYEGTVLSMGIMYTKLQTANGKTVMIPNGKLSSASISNATSQGKRQIEVTIGIDYRNDIRKAKEVIAQLIEAEPSRLKDEDYQIFVAEYADSAIMICFRFWVVTEEFGNAKWRTMEELKYKFDENGISIPFNQLDVNIVNQA